MDHVETGTASARLPLASMHDHVERPRLVRWATFDKNTALEPSARYCWLDCETGRLVFSDSKEQANT